MPRLPRVVGLVLCDRMEIDVQNGQMSLVGVFQSSAFLSFPTAEQTFTVYCALWGGSGEGTMEFVITHLPTERDIYRHRRWRALPGAGQVMNLEIKVRRCIYPAPGRYAASLRFDNRELTLRYFDVFLRRSGP